MILLVMRGVISCSWLVWLEIYRFSCCNPQWEPHIAIRQAILIPYRKFSKYNTYIFLGAKKQICRKTCMMKSNHSDLLCFSISVAINNRSRQIRRCYLKNYVSTCHRLLGEIWMLVFQKSRCGVVASLRWQTKDSVYSLVYSEIPQNIITMVCYLQKYHRNVSILFF